MSRILHSTSNSLLFDETTNACYSKSHLSNNLDPSSSVENNLAEPTSSNPTPNKKKEKVVGDYLLGRTLGSGSMGKLAVKIIPIKDLEMDENKRDKSRTQRIEREIALMGLLDHPYIVKLKDHLTLGSNYYLFFEHVSGGQLLDYIISHGRLSEKQARKFARQMISSVMYCHKNAIVHRDLKIENVLITNNGNIKVIDFGLSNLYSTNSQLNTFCGSLYFAAPELLSAKEYLGPEVDVWSLGVIFYVLVTGRVPFDDNNMPALHAKIKKGNVAYPMWISKECKAMLMRMLVTNPSERATLDEIMKCQWINKGYASNINIHFPVREPIKLPLNNEVISKMSTGFQFGDDIEQKLTKLLKSEFAQSIKSKNSKASLQSAKIGDFRKYMFKTKKDAENSSDVYPLISIYYLVKEQMQRDGLLPCVNEDAETNTSNEKTLKFDDSVQENTDIKKKPNLIKKLSQSGIKNKNKLFHRWSMLTDENNLSKSERNKKHMSSTAPSKLKRRWSKLGFNQNKSNSSSDKKSESISLNDVITPESDNLPKTPTTNVHENKIKWNTMSLKGVFSAQTTSTKKPKVIEKNLFDALAQLGIKYTVTDDGHLECFVYNANSFVSADAQEGTSSESLHGQRTPIICFQIQLVKIRLLKLYGVKFRRLKGGPWEYKSICSLLLSKLNL